jgi:hypothetical protein
VTGDATADVVFLSELIGTSLAAQYGIQVMAVDTLTLRLTGQAPQAEYGDVLSEIKYENTADEPGNVTREVQFTIEDNDGFISMATTRVTIIPTNDRAIITFGDGTRSLVYDESARIPLNLFNENDTITDSDGNTLDWLAIRLTPGVDSSDVIAVDVEGTGLMVTTTTASDGEVLLNISGNADLSDYESILNSVTFVNVFPGMAQAPRRLEVVTYDGETPSAVHPITIAIDSFNDPPLCFFNAVSFLGS